MLTKNSFIDEIKKQYVVTARAKGLNERQVLYGHVFRNAMLIVIAGFPGAFISAFFTGSLLIENIFSLDGLGRLGYLSVVNRDYPIVFATLYIFSLLGLVRQPDLRPDLYLDRSAHRLRAEGRLMDTAANPTTATPVKPPRKRPAVADQHPPLAEFQGQPARLLVALAVPRPVRASACLPNSSPTTGRSSPPTRARSCFPSWSIIRKRSSAASWPRPITAPTSSPDEINANGWMIWPPIRYSYRSVNSNIPHSAPTAPFWLMGAEERCSGYPQGAADPGCSFGNLNWLGTDDQARDVLARVIYGFRISVLFGLVLTICSAVIGVTAGAMQGYFGGWTDLLLQRFIEIWSSMPVLYILLDHRRDPAARLLRAARASCCSSPGSASSASCAPSSCAPATSNMCAPPARSASTTGRSCGGTCCRTRWWRR